MDKSEQDMKTLVFDVMLDGRFIHTFRYQYCPLFPIDEEELFLAIPALRDDTDKYQWFTDGDLWFKCGDEVCNEGRKIHKATVNELIEHFKIKEEQ